MGKRFSSPSRFVGSHVGDLGEEEMSGFVNTDGSELVGAIHPTNGGQGLRVDVDGNLKVVTASGISAPLVTQDQIRGWISNGQGFIGSTGVMNSATGTNNNPLCIFNPASSGKSILIYQLSLSSGTAGANSVCALLQYVTTDPAYSSAANVINARAGGAASTIAASCTFTTVNQSIAGTVAQFVASNAPIELLTHGSALWLPAGLAAGVRVFMQTYAAGIGGIIARWIEI